VDPLMLIVLIDLKSTCCSMWCLAGCRRIGHISGPKSFDCCHRQLQMVLFLLLALVSDC